MDFDTWFNKLLNVNIKHSEYPLGSCCYRDVLREKNVKKALREAWERIIVNGEDSDDIGM